MFQLFIIFFEFGHPVLPLRLKFGDSVFLKLFCVMSGEDRIDFFFVWDTWDTYVVYRVSQEFLVTYEDH